VRVAPAACRILALALLVGAVTLLAQQNVTGDWTVEFSTKLGSALTTMSLQQNGDAVAGYISTERNETPLKGTMRSDRLTVSFEQPVEGKIVRITFEAVVKGRTMSGTVRFGNLADGPFYAERK
jgi:hypothetical protein